MDLKMKGKLHKNLAEKIKIRTEIKQRIEKNRANQ